MLFLWIFGDNVEHRIGHIPYLVFYLVAGVIASFAQILVDTDSVIPTLGASGAISGVLGAYLVMFPTNRVTVLLLRFPMRVPAIVAIGLWAVLQFISGFACHDGEAGGVAYMAHIGGFVAGVVGRAPVPHALQRAASTRGRARHGVQMSARPAEAAGLFGPGSARLAHRSRARSSLPVARARCSCRRRTRSSRPASPSTRPTRPTRSAGCCGR